MYAKLEYLEEYRLYAMKRVDRNVKFTTEIKCDELAGVQASHTVLHRFFLIVFPKCIRFSKNE